MWAELKSRAYLRGGCLKMASAKAWPSCCGLVWPCWLSRARWLLRCTRSWWLVGGTLGDSRTVLSRSPHSSTVWLSAGNKQKAQQPINKQFNQWGGASALLAWRVFLNHSAASGVFFKVQKVHSESASTFTLPFYSSSLLDLAALNRHTEKLQTNKQEIRVLNYGLATCPLIFPEWKKCAKHDLILKAGSTVSGHFL